VNNLISQLRHGRVVAFAAVLLVVAQFSLVSHDVLAEHALDEHCAICLSQDRLDDVVASDAQLAIPAVDYSFSFTPVSPALASANVSYYRSRAPPVL